MTAQAFILIQTDNGKAGDVANAIRGMKGITLAEDVTGPYDVIVRAEAEDVDELGKLVVALAGCGSDAVEVHAPGLSARAAETCRSLVEDLPDTVAGQQRRPVSPE